MNKQITAEIFSRPNNRIRLHLSGPSRSVDTRAVAIRADLADVATATHHLAPHYAAATPYACTAANAIVVGDAKAGASAVTQLLHGELFHVLDLRAGWAWGYCGHDHYVGYVPVTALGRHDGQAVTHHVPAPGGLLFAGPDIKAAATTLPGGALLRGGDTEGDFLRTQGGYVHARHWIAAGSNGSDWIATARAYLGMAYLWGGRGGGGIDCSGLVQVALGQCGIAVPRDTDQQADAIGRALNPDEPLIAGDIVFFPGHVGIMTDGTTLLHANAFWMRVVEEPLADVIARLAPLHAQPVTIRRRLAS
jgi:cell wall-associated NlpC family hydrolase